jgi:hypothetical protein
LLFILRYIKKYYNNYNNYNNTIKEAARLLREGGEESPAALSARQMEQYAATYSRATSRQVTCFIKALVPVLSGYLSPWPVAFSDPALPFSPCGSRSL